MLNVRFKVLAWALLSASLLAQADQDPHGDVVRSLQAALAASDPAASSDAAWRACLTRHGSIDPALRWLKAQAQEPDVLRLHAALCRRVGDLEEARRSLERLPESARVVADLLSLAEVLDALDKKQQAIAAYDKLLEGDLDPDTRNRIILRTALMQPGRNALAKAAANWEPSLKNQAAIILALQNQQKKALKLYEVTGEGTKRFQQEMRLAEWALEVKLRDEAQQFAWAAVRSAKMRRDRRYALAMLVSAYRQDDAIDELITLFEEAPDLDEDSRLTWIDLLRETGKVDDALRLFREAAGETAFTNDMRRQLLELCREAGREETLVEAYGELIEAQSRTIEWREGLARHYLERGDRTKAAAVWRSYLDQVENTRPLMAAAESLMGLGMDQLAADTARRCLGRDTPDISVARLFLFELFHARARDEEAVEQLARLAGEVPADDPVNLDIAAAYERVGDKEKAVTSLHALKTARGPRSGVDADIKLAILYSEIGQEEQAQGLWLELWKRVDSIPRRKFVEERVMTVASRLGTLARVAVELESKLMDGTATDREAGMLVSLYIRVNDAVSATEIIEEHLKKKGGSSVDVLVEKARLFQSCNDHYNYGKTVRELIRRDPEGRPDYLRELAMSLLEQGQRREARDVLKELKEAEGATSTSGEFEAGVLSLAGMHQDALRAYDRSLALNPDRIDTYLLLANALVQMGKGSRAKGMFQNLAASPVKDDLFTIAVDGVLNLLGPRRPAAPSPLLEWTRRMALERVARKPDKLYLYQLVADLSDEHRDPGMAKRALKAALPIAGEQRTPLLRELMERTRKDRDRGGVIAGSVAKLTGRKVGSNAPSKEHLMFGRRLLGQGELVPPDVYLDLGSSFLAGRDVASAARTFNAASKLPEFDSLQRKIAEAFESARYYKEALRIYERILTVEPRDTALLEKVGGLHERLGRDDLAGELFRRGMRVLIASRPFSQTEEGPAGAPQGGNLLLRLSGSRNADPELMLYPQLLAGILATTPDAAACQELLDEVASGMDRDLRRVAEGDEANPKIGRHPRLALNGALHRRLATAFGKVEAADRMDGRLLDAMKGDPRLVDAVMGFRIRWGFYASGRKLLAQDVIDPAQRGRYGLRLRTSDAASRAGLVSISRAAPLVLPTFVHGGDDGLRRLIERVDLSDAGSDLETLTPLITASLCLGDGDLCLALLRLGVDAAFSRGKTPAQLNLAFTDLMLQTRQIRLLTPEQRRGVMQRMVDRVAADPDRCATIIRRLYTFVTPDDDFITAKDTMRLIRAGLAASDGIVYGIPNLFRFMPPEERYPAFRQVFPLVATAQRAYFIATFALAHDVEDAGFRGFLLGEFKRSVRDAANPLLISSAAQRLMRELRPRNIGLILDMLDVVEKQIPDRKVPFQVISQPFRNKTGLDDDLWAAFLAVWDRYADRKDVKTRDLVRATASMADARGPELQARCEALQDKAKARELLAALKLRQRNVAEQPQTLAQLREKSAANPQDTAVMASLADTLHRDSRWAESALTLERLIELKPDDEEAREALEERWTFLRNPVRALAARKEGTTKKTGKPGARTATIGRPGVPMRALSTSSVIASSFGRVGSGLPQVSEADVRKALTKDAPDARALYRSLWRQSSGNRFVSVIRSLSPVRRISNRSALAAARREALTRADLRSIYDKTPAFLQWTAPVWKPRSPDRKKLPFLMAKTPFGADELTRQLRSLEPNTLGQPDAAVAIAALIDAQISEAGGEVIEPILERDRQGRASALDYELLFVALEMLEERPEGITEDVLDTLLDTVAQETSQVKRLAGLYARFGYQDKASALYRWCGCSRGAAGPPGSIVRQTPDHSALLKEVLGRLEGAPRARAVATILKGGRLPPHDRNMIDGFENEVLGMLIALDGPTSATEQAGSLVASLWDLALPPRRETMMRASGLLARAGEHHRALELMELAMSAREAPDGVLSSHASLWEQPRALHAEDLRWLFPVDPDGFKDMDGWLAAAASRLDRWRTSKTVNHPTARDATALIAIRLGTAGAPAFDQVLNDLRSLVDETPADQLLVAEALRAAGRESQAVTMERTLLDDGRLHPERVPGLVAWVLKADGAEAALALGRQLVEITLHPRLLAVMVTASQELSDDEQLSYWKQQQSEAEDALRRLKGKPVTKKPAPKAPSRR